MDGPTYCYIIYYLIGPGGSASFHCRSLQDSRMSGTTVSSRIQSNCYQLSNHNCSAWVAHWYVTLITKYFGCKCLVILVANFLTLDFLKLLVSSIVPSRPLVLSTFLSWPANVVCFNNYPFMLKSLETWICAVLVFYIIVLAFAKQQFKCCRNQTAV